MRKLIVVWMGIVALSGFAQQNPSDSRLAPNPWIEELDKLKNQPVAQNTQSMPASQQPVSMTIRLSLKDAEGIALKNNPQISVARLNALASHQVTRGARSGLLPSALDRTAVDAHDNSRITAGGLNNPIIFPRAAGGVTVSQLITDFGHTTN